MNPQGPDHEFNDPVKNTKINGGAERTKVLEGRIQSASNSRDKIQLLTELAWEVRMVESERVAKLCQEAEHLSRTDEFTSEPYDEGVASAMVCRAFVELYAGNLDTAFSKCLHAQSLLPSYKSPIAIRIWFTLGWTNFFLGDFPLAMENGLKALTLARELGDDLHIAWTLDAIASVHGVTGDFDSALPLHEESLVVFRRLNELMGEMRALNNMATTLLEMKESEKAFTAAAKSLEIAREYQLEADICNNFCTIADILVYMGRIQDAESKLREALEKYAIITGLPRVSILERMGNVFLVKGDFIQAETFVQKALDMAVNLNQRGEIAMCHRSLSEIFERMGKPAKALAHYKIFHNLQNEIQGDQAAKRLAVLKIAHQVETALNEARILRLEAAELQQTVEEQKAVQSLLEIKSTRDPLTNLFNRRHFDEALNAEFSRHTRSGSKLSILIMDVDHFKEYNDAYGHVKGDECLRQIAGVLQQAATRPADVVARYGGEEFVCLLPETNLTGALMIAGQIRDLVNQLAIPHNMSSVHQVVTLSIGVLSAVCDFRNSVTDLIVKADEQLYIAKSRGRNRIEASESDASS